MFSVFLRFIVLIFHYFPKISQIYGDEQRVYLLFSTLRFGGKQVRLFISATYETTWCTNKGMQNPTIVDTKNSNIFFSSINFICFITGSLEDEFQYPAALSQASNNINNWFSNWGREKPRKQVNIFFNETCSIFVIPIQTM